MGQIKLLREDKFLTNSQTFYSLRVLWLVTVATEMLISSWAILARSTPPQKVRETHKQLSKLRASYKHCQKGGLGNSALMRQLVQKKGNSEFKPVKIRLKIDLMPYPACTEGS